MELGKEALRVKTPDIIARWLRSWYAVGFMVCFITTWLFCNIAGLVEHWDPYPFDTLKIILMIQAAFTGPILLMHQHRQSENDRVIRRAVYETDQDIQRRIKNLEEAVTKLV